MEQIITAATEVFAETGYEGTTTNAIAARAGISPGSLYQFFKNKDDIVRALTERYVIELGAAHAGAFASGELATMPLDVVVQQVLGPLVEFNREHRAFKVLFARTDMPQSLSEATAPLHEAMFDRVTALFAARAPELGADYLRRVAAVTIQLVKALMPLVAAAGPDDVAWYRRQLEVVLVRYLEAALSTG